MNSKLIIYQTLPRLFGNTCQKNKFMGTIEENCCGKMRDYNDKALRSIKALGSTHIWFTGIIQHASKSDYSRYGCHKENPYVIKGNAGSPYAISDYYSVSPDLAVNPEKRMKEFDDLVKRTHAHEMKVIIDFVPNHVARVYKSIMKPEWVRDLGENDNPARAFDPQNNFYYIPGSSFEPNFHLGSGYEQYVEYPAKATGNDCFQPNPGINDWYETVKLNYGVNYENGSKSFDPTPDTWRKMLDILLYWAAKGVDGFRCDMVHMVPIEFWEWCLPQVKQHYPDIIFIAEIYTPAMYRDYIFRGKFDYLYDKVGLYDKLKDIIQWHASASEITGCWQAVDDIQQHMVNFLENHDEQRIASEFFAGDPFKAVPALIVSALENKNPFMIYFGQELGEAGMELEGFSGRDGRTSIFDYWSIDKIIRWGNNGSWNEDLLSEDEKCLRHIYKTVLTSANKEKSLREGSFFDLMYVNYNNPDFDTNRQYAFLRKHEDELCIIIVNFDNNERYLKVNIPEHAFNFLEIQEKSYQMKELITRRVNHTFLSSRSPFECNVPGNSGVIWKVKLSK